VRQTESRPFLAHPAAMHSPFDPCKTLIRNEIAALAQRLLNALHAHIMTKRQQGAMFGD
jgi:hypothetical protein